VGLLRRGRRCRKHRAPARGVKRRPLSGVAGAVFPHVAEVDVLVVEV
jgi:hypothetical protein